MAELIDRRVAIDALRKYIVDNGMYDMDENVQGFNDGISCAISELSGVPSAQPEIIRCKDCKWADWYVSAANGEQYAYCMETGVAGRTADDFCSYGEREDG